MPSDQLSPEAQQAAAAEHRRWLQHQPLLARLFTSQQQEDSIRSLTQRQQAAGTAISDAPNGAEVDMLQLDAGRGGGGDAASAAADILMLKQDMLRMEMLVADALKVCMSASVLRQCLC
jgi:hypothetical protein